MTRFLFTDNEVLVRRIMKHRIHTDEKGQTYTDCVVTTVGNPLDGSSMQWAVRGERIKQ